jgi:DNA-binding transcriptional MerR regulator
MSDQAALTINDLERESGLPRRTVHFYVQQGVLPPPVGTGPAARYSATHLLRLRALRALQGAGWRLDDIRRGFARANDETVRDWLEVRPPPPRLAPAVDLNGVNARRPGLTRVVAPENLADNPPPTPALRYQLADDVELLARAPLSPTRRVVLEQLVAHARRVLRSTEEDEPSD